MRVAETARGAAGTPVVLVGFMGAGKSAVGRALAARCDVPFVDCDEVIECEQGSIDALFASQGEQAFRALEEAAVLRVLDEAAGQARVVALGGGAVVSEAVRRRLAAIVHVVWLEAPLDELWRRAGMGEGVTRPLARDREAFARLLDQRGPLYAEVARLRVSAGADRELSDVVEEIVRHTGLCADRTEVGR